MLKFLLLSYSELFLITAHCSWIVKYIYIYIYIFFYSHQLSLLSSDSYGLAMAVIWQWFDVLTMVFFSLIDGPMVIVWFLGHGVVFLGHGSRCGFFFFCCFLWLRWIWLVVGGGDGRWMWWLCYR